jgi:hypothetical protein
MSFRRSTGAENQVAREEMSLEKNAPRGNLKVSD